MSSHVSYHRVARTLPTEMQFDQLLWNVIWSESSMHSVISAHSAFTLLLLVFFCRKFLFPRWSSNGSIFAIASSKRQLFFQCYFHVNVVLCWFFFLTSYFRSFGSKKKMKLFGICDVECINPFSWDSVVWILVSTSPLAILSKCKQKTTLNERFFFCGQITHSKKLCSFVVDETTSSNIYKGSNNKCKKKRITRPFANGHTDEQRLSKFYERVTNPVNLQKKPQWKLASWRLFLFSVCCFFGNLFFYFGN